MFHAGHVAILKQAREFGDYLIAGVHSDEVVNAQRGLNMPIMNLNERVLSVLGCAYVNDVLIDAPLRITRCAFDLFIRLRCTAQKWYNRAQRVEISTKLHGGRPTPGKRVIMICLRSVM